MLIIPAIDLKDGHCVRLEQGDMSKATVFSEDPSDMASQWAGRGAKRLHVVEFKNLPAGAYEVRAEVLSADTVRGTATRELMVLGAGDSQR